MRDATYDDEDLRPRRGRAAHDRGDEAPRPSLWRQILGRNPGDRIALVLMGFIAVGIVVNALVRQSGPHPAPLFATAVIRPAPVPVARPADVQQTASITPRHTETQPAAPATQPAGRSRQEIVSDVQRELQRRRLYDGTIDGLTGPKTEAAIRKFEADARLAPTGEATEALLARLKRGGPAQAAARPAAPAARAPQAPQGPQNIADLIARDPRAATAPRPTQAPRERSIGDLIAADSGQARR